MAYQAITPEEIASGEHVSAETQNKIKGNFEDHEDRLLSVESGGNTTYPAWTFNAMGAYGNMAFANGVMKSTINFDLTINGVFLIIGTAGTSGTTDVDIKYSRAGGAYTSIFTTRPSVGYAAGNGAASSNAILNSTEAQLQAGDIIRVDILGAQTGAYDFILRIDYQKD